VILYIGIAVVVVMMARMIRPLNSTATGAISAGRVHPLTNGKSISRQKMLNIAALLFIFTLLFSVAMLRVNIGNDYLRYIEFMHLIFVNAFVPTEIGFNTVVRLVYSMSGFYNYFAVFALFSLFSLAIFLVAIYRDSEDFFFSFLLFIAFGYYFQTFNSIRYYLAVPIALLAMGYLLRGKKVHFIGLILVGALFHRSILVVLPLYFLATLNWKRWMLAAAGVLCLSSFFFQDLYLQLLLWLYPTYRGTDLLEGGTSIVNIVRCGGVLVLSLIYYRQTIQDNTRNRFFFYCNMAAFALYTCGSFIPEISRIGVYLTITHIYFLPAIINKIENKQQRFLLKGAVIVVATAFLLVFLSRADMDGVRLLPYQTILFDEVPRMIMITY
jgi:hypothetical protein